MVVTECSRELSYLFAMKCDGMCVAHQCGNITMLTVIIIVIAFPYYLIFDQGNDNFFPLFHFILVLVH